MFQSIQFTDQITHPNSPDCYLLTYHLTDTDFKANLELSITQQVYNTRINASVLPSAVITVYAGRNLNVPRNLAAFYSYNFISSAVYRENTQDAYVKLDKDWTDQHFPDIKFGEKYYDCTVNQIARLRYAGKFYKGILE